MTRKEFDEILHRYLNDRCTDVERQLVEDWFQSMDQGEHNTDIQEQLHLKEKLWATLEAKAQPASAYTHYGKIWRAAAAIAILAVSAFLVFQYRSASTASESFANITAPADGMIRFANTGNVAQQIELNDGSHILLQPGAEIRYPDVFGEIREVYLTGEAFFQVARDVAHPFHVYTNEVVTKVLGTSFTIKANQGEKQIVVAVKTGKVSVLAHSDKRPHRGQQTEVILTPNQQAVYDREADKVVKNLVEQPQILVAQEPLRSNYTNTPVIEIFETMEKSYGVDLLYDEELLSGCTITTDLGEEGLYERLEIICHALGAEYTIENAEIRITSKGCK